MYSMKRKYNSDTNKDTKKIKLTQTRERSNAFCEIKIIK